MMVLNYGISFSTRFCTKKLTLQNLSLKIFKNTFPQHLWLFVAFVVYNSTASKSLNTTKYWKNITFIIIKYIVAPSFITLRIVGASNIITHSKINLFSPWFFVRILYFICFSLLLSSIFLTSYCKQIMRFL